MKNANVFVDVDLTLVDQNPQLLEGAKAGLESLVAKGCHVYLWSTGGAEYCQKIVRLHQLQALVEGCCPKPDIIIDDMPSTALNPFHFDVHRDGGWQKTVEQLLKKHVD